tara:strand:- start:420 stop:1163 length:744 start_codon:yes stop_codon:yes gene_type:complete
MKRLFIDTETKVRLCAEDPKSAEIIKPILRGKDIKKYQANWAGLWLIVSHNGYNEKDKRIPRIEIKNYPAVKNHLDQYLPQLTKRSDKGDTPYNLRNCAYMLDFKKDKILFSKASKEKSFAYNFLENYLQNTSYLITGHQLKFLISCLNSNFINFIFLEFYQGGGIDGEITLQAIEQIPIPEISSTAQQPFIKLVNQILEGKKADEDTSALEHQIDVMVYHLYELNYEDALVIDEHLSKEDFERYKI